MRSGLDAILEEEEDGDVSILFMAMNIFSLATS